MRGFFEEDVSGRTSLFIFFASLTDRAAEPAAPTFAQSATSFANAPGTQTQKKTTRSQTWP